MRRSGSTAARSSPERGAGEAITRRFSSICSGVLMPESTIFNPFKIGGKAQRKARRAAVAHLLQQRPGLVRQLASRPPRTGSITTTGLWWRRADLVAGAALHLGVLIVQIVELQLHEVQRGYSVRMRSSTPAVSWKEMPK